MSSKKHSALLRMMGALFVVLGISFLPTVIIALIYGEYFEGLCFVNLVDFDALWGQWQRAA